MRLLLLIPFLVGCTTPESRLALLNELRLDRCEVGTAIISGTINLSPFPAFGAGLNVNISEERTVDMLPEDCK